MQKNINQSKIIFTIIGLCLVLAGNVFAQNIGEQKTFLVDGNYDISSRSKIDAVLIRSSSSVYFYVEKSWWDAQYQVKRDEILKNLDTLSVEFQNNIYPKLTTTFGFERKPGIDGDNIITVLFHPIKNNEAGYFREVDGYNKSQSPASNEREMVYISTDLLTATSLKTVLAHEFVHLITFNQKNKIYGAQEETWLNEARADYSSIILGYDDNYGNSNFQQRVRDFIESPSDSITEWRNTKYDYASVSMFTHYLVDHYGVKILSDSLKSKYIGIESINYALENYGYREKFSDIFTNWTIALVINDCSQNRNYCYFDKNLNSIRVSPNINFLPVSGNASLSVIDTTKNWSGNWQKFIGGSGNLKLSFSNSAGLDFQVPYIIYDKENNYSVKFLAFDQNKKGELNIQDFGSKYNSLIILPSLQQKITGFDGADFSYPYGFTVSVTGKDAGVDQSLIEKLLAQIDSLKKQIAAILAERAGNSVGQNTAHCQIAGSLSLGMYNSTDVKCLQTFLKSKPGMYYGLVTGYFGPLTKNSVVKFQQQNGLPGTGIVDDTTRNKINQSW